MGLLITILVPFTPCPIVPSRLSNTVLLFTIQTATGVTSQVSWIGEGVIPGTNVKFLGLVRMIPMHWENFVLKKACKIKFRRVKIS